MPLSNNDLYLTLGVNRAWGFTGAPAYSTSPTFYKEDDLEGVFIYTRSAIKIYGWSGDYLPGDPPPIGVPAGEWAEIADLTGSGGSRTISVYYNNTNIKEIYVRCMEGGAPVFRIVGRYAANAVGRDTDPVEIGAPVVQNDVDENAQNLSDVYALVNHNHDNELSLLNHNHNGVYAETDHNHDGTYSSYDHNHDLVYAPYSHSSTHNTYNDARYAALNHVHGDLYADKIHNHDADYSAKDHTHDYSSSTLYAEKTRVSDGIWIHSTNEARDLADNGTINPGLYVGQKGSYFGHSMMLAFNYDGWGLRTAANKDLYFNAFSMNLAEPDENGYPTLYNWERAKLSYLTNVGMIDFTGQHRCKPTAGEVEDFASKIGMIVSSTGEYSFDEGEEGLKIDEAIPEIQLTSQENDKKVLGVVAGIETPENDREYHAGAFVTIIQKKEGDERVIVNSLGEGSMWITNVGGSLINGDYITSSALEGYGMKQEDDVVHNYTVAKITMNCDFDLNSPDYKCEEIVINGNVYKRAFVGVTYHCG